MTQFDSLLAAFSQVLQPHNNLSDMQSSDAGALFTKVWSTQVQVESAQRMPALFAAVSPAPNDGENEGEMTELDVPSREPKIEAIEPARPPISDIESSELVVRAVDDESVSSKTLLTRTPSADIEQRTSTLIGADSEFNLKDSGRPSDQTENRFIETGTSSPVKAVALSAINPIATKIGDTNGSNPVSKLADHKLTATPDRVSNSANTVSARNTGATIPSLVTGDSPDKPFMQSDSVGHSKQSGSVSSVEPTQGVDVPALSSQMEISQSSSKINMVGPPGDQASNLRSEGEQVSSNAISHPTRVSVGIEVDRASHRSPQANTKISTAPRHSTGADPTDRLGSQELPNTSLSSSSYGTAVMHDARRAQTDLEPTVSFAPMGHDGRTSVAPISGQSVATADLFEARTLALTTNPKPQSDEAMQATLAKPTHQKDQEILHPVPATSSQSRGQETLLAASPIMPKTLGEADVQTSPNKSLVDDAPKNPELERPAPSSHPMPERQLSDNATIVESQSVQKTGPVSYQHLASLQRDRINDPIKPGTNTQNSAALQIQNAVGSVSNQPVEPPNDVAEVTLPLGPAPTSGNYRSDQQRPSRQTMHIQPSLSKAASPITATGAAVTLPVDPAPMSGDILTESSSEPDIAITTSHQTQTAHQTSQAVALNRAYAPQVAHQVAAAIVQSSGGTTEIMLNPEELGRVRIAMTAGDAGLTVTILAERPETTDLMRRNIEHLTRELRDLGYDNPTFNFGSQSGDSGGSWGEDAPQSEAEFDPLFTETAIIVRQRVALSGGLDLKL